MCCFYILQSCWDHLLALTFLNNLQDFLWIRSCHQQMGEFTSLFLTCVPFILIFSCLIALVCTSSTVLNRSPHSSTLAWKIPWREEPGRLQSIGSLGVGHDWATSFSLFSFHFHALEKEMAAHSSVLAWRIPGTGEPGGLLSGVAQSRTRLKWLNSNLAAAVLWQSGVLRRLILKA